MISRAARAGAVAGTASLLPGLALVAAFVAIAFGIEQLVPTLSPLVAAVALGIVVANLGLVPAWAGPGIAFSSRRVLRVGIVLLGFQLSFDQVGSLGVRSLAVVVVVVAVTFVGTRLIARRLGLSGGLGLLVAAGYSICGASAIAAMEEVADAEEEVAVAIALVTLCGSLAIGLLPLLRDPLGLGDAEVFGAWVGASVHDVGQVVATASSGGSAALEAAVLVKLTRVALLAPMIIVATALGRRDRAMKPDAPHPYVPTPILPLFVIGFLVTATLRSTGVVPDDLLGVIRDVQRVLLAAALFALGTGVRLAKLRPLGSRPLVLGAASWLLVGTLSYVGVRIAA